MEVEESHGFSESSFASILAATMSLAPLKILIVDDHQPMREMIRAMVEYLRCETFEAANGTESLEKYRQHRPDYVLMDLMMPEMGGIEATRLLKEEFPESRVMIVTGNDSQPLRRAAQAAGACNFVLKENLQDLRKLIEGGLNLEDGE